MPTLDEIKARAKRVLAKRDDLYSDSVQEQLGELAQESRYSAKVLDIVLNGGVITEERLRELKACFERHASEYEDLAARVRKGEPW